MAGAHFNVLPFVLENVGSFFFKSFIGLGADEGTDNGFHCRFKIHARGVDDQVIVHDVCNVFMKCFADKYPAPLFTVFDPFLGLSQGNTISK